MPGNDFRYLCSVLCCRASRSLELFNRTLTLTCSVFEYRSCCSSLVLFGSIKYVIALLTVRRIGLSILTAIYLFAYLSALCHHPIINVRSICSLADLVNIGGCTNNRSIKLHLLHTVHLENVSINSHLFPMLFQFPYAAGFMVFICLHAAEYQSLIALS